MGGDGSYSEDVVGLPSAGGLEDHKNDRSVYGGQRVEVPPGG